MSVEYVQTMSAKVSRLEQHGFSMSDCLLGADIRVDAIKATCSSSADENMIIAAVQKQGGFAKLTETITKFRSDMLPADMFMPFVKKDPSLLLQAGKQAKENKQVVLAAVAQEGKALDYASRTMKATMCLPL